MNQKNKTKKNYIATLHYSAVAGSVKSSVRLRSERSGGGGGGGGGGSKPSAATLCP